MSNHSNQAVLSQYDDAHDEDCENIKKPVRSPCISICQLNDDDICIGCFRNAMEITYWGSYDNATKMDVLMSVKQRSIQIKVTR